MSNEPVAIVKKITIGGIDNFTIEIFTKLKEGTLLYTHPLQDNPLQDKLDAIANKVIFGKAQEK